MSELTATEAGYRQGHRDGFRAGWEAGYRGDYGHADWEEYERQTRSRSAPSREDDFEAGYEVGFQHGFESGREAGAAYRPLGRVPFGVGWDEHEAVEAARKEQR